MAHVERAAAVRTCLGAARAMGRAMACIFAESGEDDWEDWGRQQGSGGLATSGLPAQMAGKHGARAAATRRDSAPRPA